MLEPERVLFRDMSIEEVFKAEDKDCASGHPSNLKYSKDTHEKKTVLQRTKF